MKFFITIFLLLGTATLFAQNRTIEYNTSLSGYAATGKTLPFWQVSNQFGIVPTSNGGLLQVGVFSDFNPKHKIQFAYGASAAGFLSKDENNILIDQLYISGKWRTLRLDLGMVHPDIEYGGVSATNGSITYSGNSRSMPGYNLRTDYIAVPWTQRILSFKFNWADYMMIDDRYVHHTLVHNKSFFVKIKPSKRLEIIGGIEHWAQWGGTSPMYGKNPSSLKDYLRVVAAQEGGEGASWSDSVNVLGNHLGEYSFRLNYLGDNHTLSLYYNVPFDDYSGVYMDNLPDGLYGIYLGMTDKKKLISDITYEFFYTKYQSGSQHDRPATPEEIEQQGPDWPFPGRYLLGGNDNYFNNGEYKSGWTNYGRTIGSPFMTPMAKNADGLTLGIMNNRVLAHHLGVKGYIARKVPYKVMLSYSLNYGTHGDKFDHSRQQFSFGLEAGIPSMKSLPFNIDMGVYGDCGKLLPNSIGFSLKLTRKALLTTFKN